MNTHFAPAERTSRTKLRMEIDLASSSPIMTGLLDSVGGMLAVLDENRQIIALNTSLLQMLGIEDSGTVLGLRPGEVLKCVHADEEPGGCRTSKYCSTCGGAVAVVTRLTENEPVEG